MIARIQNSSKNLSDTETSSSRRTATVSHPRAPLSENVNGLECCCNEPANMSKAWQHVSLGKCSKNLSTGLHGVQQVKRKTWGWHHLQCVGTVSLHSNLMSSRSTGFKTYNQRVCNGVYQLQAVKPLKAMQLELVELQNQIALWKHSHQKVLVCICR